MKTSKIKCFFSRPWWLKLVFRWGETPISTLESCACRRKMIMTLKCPCTKSHKYHVSSFWRENLKIKNGNPSQGAVSTAYLVLRCRFCRNWADLRVQKAPPFLGILNGDLELNCPDESKKWRLSGMIPDDWCVLILFKWGQNADFFLQIFFLRLWRCHRIMIHDDLWVQEFCMTPLGTCGISTLEDWHVSGPKRFVAFPGKPLAFLKVFCSF